MESQGGRWDEDSSPAQKLSFQSSNNTSCEPNQQHQTRKKIGQNKKDDFYSDFDDVPSSMARSNTVDGDFDSYQNSG